jgi:hypothetical protein
MSLSIKATYIFSTIVREVIPKVFEECREDMITDLQTSLREEIVSFCEENITDIVEANTVIKLACDCINIKLEVEK